MTDLAPYVPPGAAEIDYTWNLANKLCKTEFVPANLRNKPEATLAVFLTGRELGIGPMQSLRDIYPVNGRPALMASLMVARVRGLGHRFHTIRSTDEIAVVQIHRKGEPEPEPPIEFTLADAKRAELLGKAVWRQYPKAMLWNRAASAACRRDCPEALGGATYTPEELSNGDGSTTATWGAPEPSEQSGGLSRPNDAGAGDDPASGSPPDPTSPSAPERSASVGETSCSGVEGANHKHNEPAAGAGLPPGTATPPDGSPPPPGRPSGGPKSRKPIGRGTAEDAVTVKQAGSGDDSEDGGGAPDPSLLPEPDGWER